MVDLSQFQNSAQQTLQKMSFFNDEIAADTKLDVEERLQKRRQWVADTMYAPELSNMSLKEPDAIDTDVDISNDLVQLQKK